MPKVKIVKIFGGFVALSIIGIIIPKAVYQDSKQLPQDDIACGHYAVSQTTGGSAEPLLILQTAVKRKENNKIYTEAYTLFGVPYATIVTTDCQKVQEGGYDTSSAIFRHLPFP